MRVVITGASGLIGSALAKRLLNEDTEVVALTRNVNRAANAIDHRAKLAAWDGRTADGWGHWVDGADAVINLAGESLASPRWSRRKKTALRDSRFDAIDAVAAAIRQAKVKPRLILQASAIGYYGDRGAELLDETAAPGQGFLADFAAAWEDRARVFEDVGVTTVWLRTGVVLAREGGALPVVARPFRWFVGGPMGDGSQYYSWIHLDDEVRAIVHLLRDEKVTGPYNLTAPQPVPYRVFCRALGHAMNRPAALAFPAFAARLIFGEVADELLLAGQRVVPTRLRESGFQFRFAQIADALVDLIG